MNITLDGIPEHQAIDEETSNLSLASTQSSSKKPMMREDAVAARLTDMRNAGVKLSRMAVESSVAKDKLEAWIKGERTVEITLSLSNWFTGMHGFWRHAPAYFQ